MINQCNHCKRYFAKPLPVNTFDPLYKDNQYTSLRCPHCSDENFESYYEIYIFEGKNYNQRSDLVIELEARGIKDIDKIIKECERIEEL